MATPSSVDVLAVVDGMLAAFAIVHLCGVISLESRQRVNSWFTNQLVAYSIQTLMHARSRTATYRSICFNRHPVCRDNLRNTIDIVLDIGCLLQPAYFSAFEVSIKTRYTTSLLLLIFGLISIIQTNAGGNSEATRKITHCIQLDLPTSTFLRAFGRTRKQIYRRVSTAFALNAL